MIDARTPIRLLDLFAGAGGLTSGFHAATKRYEVIRAVESDVAAAASYAANFGVDHVYQGAIEDWLANESVPEVDVVIGGPPCQGFSLLGKRDAMDKRNGLWAHYAETLSRATPKYFVLENVPAFFQSEQFEQLRESTSPGGLLEEYDFHAEVMNAADYGAAQIRKRVLVIGWHRDLKPPARLPKTHLGRHVPISKVLAKVSHSAREIDLPEKFTTAFGRSMRGIFKTSDLHLSRRYEDLSLERFSYIPQGGNRFNLPDRLKAPCWLNHTSGSGDVMGRLHWDRPSVTIRTEFFKPEKGRYLHPSENRAITHLEAALIQGFPVGYKWCGSKVSIARQIGNAVPIKLGQAIGRAISNEFDRQD
ncbi:DNA cytosine methyltransferase [Kribbella sp. NPDC055071]